MLKLPTLTVGPNITGIKEVTESPNKQNRFSLYLGEFFRNRTKSTVYPPLPAVVPSGARGLRGAILFASDRRLYISRVYRRVRLTERGFHSASSLQQTPAVSLTCTSKPPVDSGNFLVLPKMPFIKFNKLNIFTTISSNS